MAGVYTRLFRLDPDSLQFSLRTLAGLDVGDKIMLDSGGLLRVDPPGLGRRFRRWRRGESALRSMCHVEYILSYTLDFARRGGRCSDEQRGCLIRSIIASWYGLSALQRTYADECEAVYKAEACKRAIQLGLEKVVAIHRRPSLRDNKRLH